MKKHSICTFVFVNGCLILIYSFKLTINKTKNKQIIINQNKAS